MIFSSSRELWRLGINTFLTQILAPILYALDICGYLASLHRFITNPTEENLNGTNTSLSEVEVGLGKSELFYSLVITSQHGGSIVGALLTAVIVKFVPYWYLFNFIICVNILGFVVYGIASEGWMMIVAMVLVGLYTGGHVTLAFNYATDMSFLYVKAFKELGKVYDCDKTKSIHIRNYLYVIHSFGSCTGYVVATGVGVLLSHLPIEQYHSIAWFSMTYGVVLLLLFLFLFRGEMSWKDMSNIKELCQCTCKKKETKETSDVKLGPLQIFIIVSLYTMSFIEMIKWAYIDVLLNPVLSDSFGLSLGVSSYFYLALFLPRLLGSFVLLILERMKITSQAVLFIGVCISIVSYLLVTDWQTIPYDPCTEYSPFHHPDLFQNNSFSHSLSNHHPEIIANETLLKNTMSFTLHPTIMLKINDKETFKENYSTHFYCHRRRSCLACSNTQNSSQIYLTLISTNGSLTFFHNSLVYQNPESYSCSVEDHNLCLNIYHISDPNANDISSLDAEIQQLMVLPNDVYDHASNSCEKALNGECHWIPFSAITGEKCIDCPLICRGQHQTLLFPLFIFGMAVLIFSSPLMWVATIALANNQSPPSIQAIIFGGVNSVNFFGQGIGPIIADALYEGAQKRTFSSSIPLAILQIPFLFGILILYKKLGPIQSEQMKQAYTKVPSQDVNKFETK